MSRWLLPVQEGTQLWSATTKQPIATRVIGVRSAEQARTIAATFEPQISHFHQAQTSIRSLSGQNVYKSRSEPVRGLRLTYSFIQGLEYLIIEVSPSLAAHVEQVHKRYRDLVLITLDYDDMWGIKPYHSAYLTVPMLQGLPSADGPVRGVAHEDVVDFADDGSKQPVVQFPPLEGHARFADPFTERTSDGHHRSTVLLDTRPITGLPTYVVDIYGTLTLNEDRDSTCRITGWFYDHQEPDPTVRTLLHEFQDSFGGSSPVTIPAGHEEGAADDWWTLPIYPEVDTYDPFPPNFSILGLGDVPTGWDGVITYTGVGSAYYNPSDSFILEGATHHTGDDSTGFYEWIVTYTYTVSGKYIYSPLTTRDPGPNVTRRPNVTAMLLDSDTILGTVRTSGSESIDDMTPCGAYSLTQDFTTWEFRSMFPTHPADFNFGAAPGSVTSPRETGAVNHHMDKNPICRITFDREHTAVTIGPVP